jgi:catechol 2,3-dioxygenase-like lactoylglutathione lyase family enzyme
MFTIADQDAAIAYYTGTLGWELKADVPMDPDGNRWIEVAPPGSAARLALNPPMGEWGPGGSAIGVETPDAEAERARCESLGVTVGEMIGGEGPIPRMFSITDPDGNHIWVVQVP